MGWRLSWTGGRGASAAVADGPRPSGWIPCSKGTSRLERREAGSRCIDRDAHGQLCAPRPRWRENRRMDASQAFLDNYRFLARYNAWFNERLYGACETLPDVERRRDRGAFFGSIHGTLNHLVWGDKLWLARFVAQGLGSESLSPALLHVPEGAKHATLLFDDWAALKAERVRLDAAIEAWTAGLPPDAPLRTMRYSNTQGVRREHPAWKALTHFFNHQTHHRGQVTTLLMQSGVDVGMTDLISLA
jgi:uncharacterized damage-inducible protein DinB